MSSILVDEHPPNQKSWLKKGTNCWGTQLNYTRVKVDDVIRALLRHLFLTHSQLDSVHPGWVRPTLDRVWLSAPGHHGGVVHHPGVYEDRLHRLESNERTKTSSHDRRKLSGFGAADFFWLQNLTSRNFTKGNYHFFISRMCLESPSEPSKNKMVTVSTVITQTWGRALLLCGCGASVWESEKRAGPNMGEGYFGGFS